jgi:hypothetical protein
MAAPMYNIPTGILNAWKAKIAFSEFVMPDDAPCSRGERRKDEP